MPIKTPHEISKDYYQFVDEFTQSDFEDEKILGKFYTDYDIAGSMMRMWLSAVISLSGKRMKRRSYLLLLKK